MRCLLEGCDREVPPRDGAGRPGKYCCASHRARASQLRALERRAEEIASERTRAYRLLAEQACQSERRAVEALRLVLAGRAGRGCEDERDERAGRRVGMGDASHRGQGPREAFEASFGQARRGCCDTWPKPCSYHEGWRDGWEALLGSIRGEEGVDWEAR